MEVVWSRLLHLKARGQNRRGTAKASYGSKLTQGCNNGHSKRRECPTRVKDGATTDVFCFPPKVFGHQGPVVAACMCVAEGASKATWSSRARRRPRSGAGAQVEAGRCLVRVFAGEHSTAQYVVGRTQQ